LSEKPIKVHLPDGSVRDRTLEDFRGKAGEGHLSLAGALEQAGFPLNMRCGGRGLCRGCQVAVDEDGLRHQRSCQMSTEAFLAEPPDHLYIPDASLRDHGLNGVSVFEIGDPVGTIAHREGIGLALDTGTTTLAGALWDLNSGKCLATATRANEQRRFGDNVLARIDHAVAQGGVSRDLQTSLVQESIGPLIFSLCETASIDPASISEAMASGNTVMLHSLAGESLAGFSSYPFKPVFLEGLELNAGHLDLPFQCALQLTPHLGPFVGADIAVGALASGMLNSSGSSLLVDFGTNGEILLKHKDRYWATATAAGPAFEGGRLSCGAPAARSVISSLTRSSEGWHPRLSSPGKGKANGISGAAYVDFMALGLQSGLLNEMGRFLPRHPEVREVPDENGEPERRVFLTRQLYVNEADVAELLQAKAAIAAGMLTLLEIAGLRPSDLETLFIAGGFGYHLHLPHAIQVGLIPGLTDDRLRVIGNASLGGTSLLLQQGPSTAIEGLRQQCTIVELNQAACFEDHFIDAMAINPLEM